MIGKLTNSLRMPNVSSRQAADAIKHLLHLQAEGARSARNLNPVKLYLEAQVGFAFAPALQDVPTSLFLPGFISSCVRLSCSPELEQASAWRSHSLCDRCSLAVSM